MRQAKRSQNNIMQYRTIQYTTRQAKPLYDNIRSDDIMQHKAIYDTMRQYKARQDNIIQYNIRQYKTR